MIKEKPKSLFEGVDLKNIDEIINQLEEFRQMLAGGLLEQLIVGNEEEHEEKLAELFGEPVDREAIKNKVNQAMQAIGTGRCTLKDAFGFGPDTMESFYYMGHGLFQKKNYPAARKVFHMLCMVDPIESRYYHALAATQHKQKDYLAAVKSYMSSYAYNQVEDPEIHFHCADCYLKMDDTISAIVSLGNCITACDERNQKHRLIKMRSTTLRETLLKKVQEEHNEANKAAEKQKMALKQAKSMAKQKTQDS